MNTRRGFVCGGCWTVDRIKLIDRWPSEEGLARIVGTDQHGGGSAHNLGMDIRKLDASMPVEAIGLVGNDTDGEFLLQNANDTGIDTTQLRKTDQSATSFTDVMSVVDTGKRSFFHHAGTNDILSPDDFDFGATRCRVLHLGLLGVHKTLDSPYKGDPNGWVTVLKNAKASNLQTNIELVSIDAAAIKRIGLPCLPYLDTLIINDHEIGALTDVNTVVGGITQINKCQEAAIKALGLGTMSLVVVHYPEGAVCVTRDGKTITQKSNTLPPSQVGSAVGAGDAFCAGMLYALHEKWSLADALQLAHAVAAASVRSHTTVGSVEDVDSCLALVGKQRPQ